MLVEMLGKGGRLCEPARQGELHCPLIIRPTSEDQITGNLMHVLRSIQPRWWLPGLLNLALDTDRYQRQHYRRFKISLWENRPRLPPEIVQREGSTQIDAILRWENPATTVYLEFKYLSPLSARTANTPGQDQLLRTIRVGLHEAGYFESGQFFEPSPRQLVVLVIGPERGQPLVEQYRDRAKLKIALGERQPTSLPMENFLGELGYADIIATLESNRRWMSRCERQLAEDSIDYLRFKLQQSRDVRVERQTKLALH